MPNINETKEVARKVLPIIYVLDTSGSMSGERIASVNEAMNETMEVLKDVSNKNPDAEIKVGVLKFASGSEWVTNGLEDMEDFFWNDLQAGGVTDLGSALNELHNKLSRSEFLISETGFCVPVIMFMSDGQPTDNFEKALDSVNTNNKWFRHATKIGIAVGDDADKDVLAKVVGNKEAVIGVNDVETLKMLIKVASVTSSMINSKSRTTAENSNAVEIIKTTQAELGDDAESLDVNFDDSFSNTSSDASQADDTSSDDAWDDDGDWD
jgi:uncharacterized protein YegL